MGPLTTFFVARRPLAGFEMPSSEELERALAEALAGARLAWPEWVTTESFVHYLADRVMIEETTTRDVAQAVGALRAADLYLACACAAGNARALDAIERLCAGPIERALQHFAMSPSAIDEARQALRVLLFVTEDERLPRIAEYAGRGDLRAWVRATAVRAAWRIGRRPKGETQVESYVMRAVAAVDGDLELDYLKRRYAPDFEHAVRAAFGALPPRDRNVSRYYYGQGLGIDAIGALYRVHRSTAARWVKQATELLIAATRRLLMERLGANRSEVSSIVRLLESRIDVTVRAVAAALPDAV